MYEFQCNTLFLVLITYLVFNLMFQVDIAAVILHVTLNKKGGFSRIQTDFFRLDKMCRLR